MANDITDYPQSNWLTLTTNGGFQTFKQLASLNMFPLQLHYNSSSLATILSVKDVALIPGVYITMDTREENSMLVHYGSTFIVSQSAKMVFIFMIPTQIVI